MVPVFAFLPATAHVRDGVDEAPVHQRQSFDTERGGLRIAVGAIAVEPDRCRAVEPGVSAIEEGNGNLGAVTSRRKYAARDVGGCIVAARHVVHLYEDALP